MSDGLVALYYLLGAFLEELGRGVGSGVKIISHFGAIICSHYKHSFLSPSRPSSLQ